MLKVNEPYNERRVSSPLQMKMLGAEIADRVFQARKRRARLVLLAGDLGSGKTTFAQGFARKLSGRTRVLSPTFLLMKEYPLSSSGADEKGMLYHFDWYRVSDQKEVEMLGWKSILANPHNIVLVEWPERAPRLIPKGATNILFAHAGPKERVVYISPCL